MLFYAGANGSKIGKYGTPFYLHGYALNFAFLCVLWLTLWTTSNLIQHHKKQGILGTIILFVILCLDCVFYTLSSSVYTFFLSPISYFILFGFVVCCCLILKNRLAGNDENKLYKEEKFIENN